ncbi:MAG: hypothetical protein V4773_17810 [Verrucomicrobiota bacterium]
MSDDLTTSPPRPFPASSATLFPPAAKPTGLLRFARPLLALFLLSLLAGMAYFDVASGHEISVFPLYSIPIGLFAWCFGPWTGFGAALLSTVLWHWADSTSGHVYSEYWISYVNALSRLTFFLLVVLTLSRVKRTIDHSRQKLRAFSGPLPMCTHCRKIGTADGYWQEVQEYIAANSDAVPKPKVCPDCARHHYHQCSHQ